VLTAQKIAFYGFYVHFVVNAEKMMVNNCTLFPHCLWTRGCFSNW